jgi:hypothetical protein
VPGQERSACLAGGFAIPTRRQGFDAQHRRFHRHPLPWELSRVVAQ